MHRAIPSPAVAGVLALIGFAGAACAPGSASDDGSLDLVAAFYPLEFAAERVGGAHVSVTNPASPGVEPHDLELTPRQVSDISQADLVIFLRGFQPAVDEAVDANAAGAVLDAAGAVPLIAAAPHDDHEGEEPEESGQDPHFWLDPTRLAGFATAVAAALGDRDPGHAADYTANAAALGEELAGLDAAYADGLAGCQRREIVVSHAAYGYLADAYDLRQIAVTGLSPEEEPSPQRLAEAVHEAEEHGATTIFFETLVSPDVAEVIAEQVGADTAVLDPIEGLTPGAGGDYLSLMRQNLDALRAALDCP